MTAAPQTPNAPAEAPRRKRGRPAVATAPYDPAEILTSPADAAALLAVAFEEEDAETNGQLVVRALNAAARYRGMAEVAEAAGLNPTGLYTMLAPGRLPNIATVLRVMRALGYRLTPVEIEGEAKAAE